MRVWGASNREYTSQYLLEHVYPWMNRTFVTGEAVEAGSMIEKSKKQSLSVLKRGIDRDGGTTSMRERYYLLTDNKAYTESPVFT